MFYTFQMNLGRHFPMFFFPEYDYEDIPTYEEVELYQPKPGRFRPVVLIGKYIELCTGLYYLCLCLRFP